ncbi:MAG TPA: helix-turn-helix domain-containing protein [Solirubrobacteraceae bacterium]|nr:helix-turn-helix domain-containing protein [Solirubrobacteraceae bacterium]
MEVRTYGQYCPVARATEILAMRWTPIIVRNLLLGCETFGELMDGAPGISRTLLSSRLELLERYGVVERHDRRYLLTDAGRELESVVDALGTWGARWLEAAPEHFDAHTILWSLCRLADPDDLPGRRLVIRFELSDGPKRRVWVVLCPPDSEVCVKPPGYDEDLVVRTTSEWLAKWHMGRISLGDAMHAGLISVQGPRDLVHTLSTLGLSRFADVEPALPSSA